MEKTMIYILEPVDSFTFNYFHGVAFKDITAIREEVKKLSLAIEDVSFNHKDDEELTVHWTDGTRTNYFVQEKELI